MSQYFDILCLCLEIIVTILVITGNTLTIMAILKKSNLATASNQLIIGLALADLLVRYYIEKTALFKKIMLMLHIIPQVGFTTPYTAFKSYVALDLDGSEWNFAAKCLLSVIPFNISCTASFVHMIAISVERFLSLIFPVQHKVHFTRRYYAYYKCLRLAIKNMKQFFLHTRRARIVITGLWFYSICVASIPIFWNRNRSLIKDERMHDCVSLGFPLSVVDLIKLTFKELYL